MLTKKIYDIDLWRTPIITLALQQGEDSGRQITFRVLDDGTPKNITGYSAVLEIIKPDENVVVIDGTISDGTNGQIDVTITEQAVAVPGQPKMQLKITNPSGVTRTRLIPTVIMPSAMPGEAITSSSEFKDLTEAIRAAQRTLEESEACRDQSCQCATNSANSAEAAEASRQAAQGFSRAAESASRAAQSRAEEAKREKDAAASSAELARQKAASANASAVSAQTSAEEAEARKQEAANSATEAKKSENKALENQREAAKEATRAGEIKDSIITEEEERKQAEIARRTAESARAQAETARAEAETSRENRETTRKQNEADRKSKEQERISAEKQRSTAETSRVSAENARVEAERARVSAETARVSAEQARVSAETARVDSEGARETAERGRASAEQARVGAENSRVQAEQERHEQATADHTQATQDHSQHAQMLETIQSMEAGQLPSEINQLKSAVGNIAELETTTNNNIISAINYLNGLPHVEIVEYGSGNYQNKVASAEFVFQLYDEVVAEFEERDTVISNVLGNLKALTTTHKDNLVNAINEVNAKPSTAVTDTPTANDSATAISSGWAKSFVDSVAQRLTALKNDIVGKLNKKVDKVSGKGLSTEDYTTADKQKVTNLDTTINTKIATKADKTTVGTLGNLTTTAKNSLVEAINEVNAKPSTPVTDTPTEDSNTAISAKWAFDNQAKIDRIETLAESPAIRVGTSAPPSSYIPNSIYIQI